MKAICITCVGEEGLREFVEGQETIGRCHYCKATKVRVADSDDVFDLIELCIPRHYEDPANSVGYSSEEGGYHLSTMDSREVLEDAGLNDANDDFLDDAVDRLDNVCTAFGYQLADQRPHA